MATQAMISRKAAAMQRERERENGDPMLSALFSRPVGLTPGRKYEASLEGLEPPGRLT